MPIAVPCRTCRRLSLTAQCPECEATEEARLYADRKAAGREVRTYYHSAEWRSLASACKDRDFRRCVHCGSTERLTAHHIIAREKGGPDELGNLVTLCMGHHSSLERAIDSGDVDDHPIIVSIREHMAVLSDPFPLLEPPT